ncbi:hypothetical protein N7492_000392 [Penicillium capsulatum]|uniref:SRR1-like domain-containing protein n=1 Tax=Penicillium capsulatum TaxID=69766 RepID=A0A9W9IVU1_9EURO|nr:hypothetical protein N7492_000392 [Penicillium capsulatum]KAJ6130545.1 hypothetical protein N7512_003325 [Penicillium capsulatum]
MPHTARNKRTSIPAQKRLQVTDDDGWTHVTSGSNVRRVSRSTRSTAQPNRKPSSRRTDAEPVLGPAEAPSQLTFAELQTQYAGYREKWMSSETWAGLQAHMKEQMRSRQRIAHDEPGAMGVVDGIVSIGLGSPSGFLRDGWVDRRNVSMYQLAALESIMNQLSRPDDDIPFSFPVYVQDPVFNALDTALLESLGMIVVPNPVGFERVTRNTLLFCPGAERKHLELVLPSNPCLVLGGPLESSDSDGIAEYVARTRSRTLVPFAAQEHAFWNMRLYCREEE